MLIVMDCDSKSEYIDECINNYDNSPYRKSEYETLDLINGLGVGYDGYENNLQGLRDLVDEMRAVAISRMRYIEEQGNG